MNKTAIKNFAIDARNTLIEQVKQKAYQIGISKDGIKDGEDRGEGYLAFKFANRVLTPKEVGEREELIKEIKNKGYEQVMEEVAYTWFNRFVALRYMEVNNYLPTGVRVLSSIEGSKAEPDIIREALHLGLDIDKEKVYQYQDENKTDELYKYLLIEQCNELNQIMPFIFEKIADYTEILLPDNLLAEKSVITKLVNEVEEEDWQEGVEIIGWLYQFYISEKKDEVFASKKKIKKEEIPAATQLFTPKWIVKYMVENSLGKLWLESGNLSDSLKEKLKEEWEYYLEEAEQEPEVAEELEKIRVNDIRPEEIKVLDPACGSGHILVYAFDVLYEIYQSVGYSSRDIPKLILENNLYGLDIDNRAAQLAYFAVMMKAREKNRRIFRKPIELNITAIQESNSIGEAELKIIKDSGAENISYLIDIFEDAKDYGSILEVEAINEEAMEAELEILKDKLGLFYDRVEDILLALIKQAQIMGQKYEIVCTNPPYMGSRNMNSKLKKYLKKNFENSKRDLFSVFIEKCIDYSIEKYYIAMITQHSWMFLSSFEKLRKQLLTNITIESMVHLGPKTFEEIGGEVVQSTSFIMVNNLNAKYNGTYLRLTDYNNPKEKKKQYFDINNKNTTKYSNFHEIPSSPIAYWISDTVIEIFKQSQKLDDIARVQVGLQTSNNNYFLKLWHEVKIHSIGFNFSNSEEAKKSGLKWFPYHKGGTYRKWYGNQEYIVNWQNDGKEIKEFVKNKYPYLNGNADYVVKDRGNYFKEGITWSNISSKFSTRYSSKGFMFDQKGSMCFPFKEDIYTLNGFLNSKVANHFLNVLSATLDYNKGDIIQLPYEKKVVDDNQILKEKTDSLVQQNIEISKIDWDSFEISWDFKRHPLLTHKDNAQTIEEAFNNWSDFAEEQFYQLKANEEELNRIFIDIYGLEDELSPEVEEKDVTVRKADRERDIKSFISYAVGCMLGRYSLDIEGLAYAGGEFDASKYQIFSVDEDGIIPITKDEYFDDDIVAKFVEFVKVTFGEENLEENLNFIADTLSKRNSNSRETLRTYFITKSKFYHDHTRRYNKCPIYWLFQSDSRGKAFNVLIYMHRYDKGMVSKIRIDYLHKLQKKLEAEKQRLEGIIDSEMSSREKSKAKNKLSEIDSDLQELLEYDQELNHVANQQIEIDLDDGVKENYPKFKKLLAKI
ncbi:Eco57I restriction-modification methylase [Orenia metallireducens]|uniref:site-specific DNA-methyltransferase (adenine-specific) n=1 Tax=Orenia metallireducens TaxID=1413210 RepID=A0A285HTE5_9FIRM|nr:BREX-1 system adenine-specific DNA-methyltransferase PglX [Orenia metallireducens]PRX24088.1 Eco57I restriction-modification methylase [Orenia metallireducens]SNY39008.1 Eco57I restriction-modification methylase [Orenia metallireducens]